MSRRVQQAETFGRVALLMGGQSAERSISLISGKAVLAAMQRLGIDVTAVDVDASIGEKLSREKFDRAFVILHGRGGEDGQIQGLLQTLQIPFTGSDVSGAVLSMNKRLSKYVWERMGLPTPAYMRLTAASDAGVLIDRLGLPLIIKPVNEGSSIGMSMVVNVEELQTAIELALRYDSDVIAEQWIQGAEYTVSILDGEALPVIRLKTPNAFYDFEAKYQSHSTEYRCPCGLDAATEQRCQQLALDAFAALDMTGWGRVDLMADEQGDFYLLEANSVPGMTDHSLVPMAAKTVEMDFDALVWRILETSFEESE